MERIFLLILNPAIQISTGRKTTLWSTDRTDSMVEVYPEGDGQFMRVAKKFLALETSRTATEAALFATLTASNPDDIALVAKLTAANDRTLALLRCD